MKKLLVIWLALILVMNPVFAGVAVPVTSMQNSISGVIQHKAIKRGFAANDPRFGATLNLVSSGLGTAAAGAATVMLAGVTAPAWVTGAIAIGVGAVVSYGVSLALDGVVKWAFSADKTDTTPITQSGSQVAQPVPAGLTAGQPHWVTNSYRANDAMSTIRAVFGDNYAASYAAATSFEFWIGDCSADTSTTYNCNVKRRTKADGTVTNYSNIRASYVTSPAPRTCPTGQVSNATVCVVPTAYPDKTPNSGADGKIAVQTAVDSLTAAELAKPLNPQLVATIADKAWADAAAKPGYNGLPYIASDPITAADADAWRAANPQNWPTVQEFVKPQTMTNTPFSVPTAPAPVTTQDPSAPAQGTNPGAANPVENLGIDPGIGAPVLETTPTVDQILKPIFDLMPSFRTFTTPSHSAVCPKPAFDIFGAHIVMDSQCTIAESTRSTLYSVMLAVWAIAAAFIILRA